MIGLLYNMHEHQVQQAECDERLIFASGSILLQVIPVYSLKAFNVTPDCQTHGYTVKNARQIGELLFVKNSGQVGELQFVKEDYIGDTTDNYLDTANLNHQCQISIDS